eukprot:CAMPEP_0173199840 /NCGR_PEP_ID=MMETSP1141-20130122/17456_1 /TAXON_ID=483371 /ORGANISM="non described non described, Strain CCMP2298" /LENGTH=37 /DNA_ID= /DNA_START= /DNA_END= /DNA_ORIENTATION=
MTETTVEVNRPVAKEAKLIFYAAAGSTLGDTREDPFA